MNTCYGSPLTHLGGKLGKISTLPTVEEGAKQKKKNGFIGIYLRCNPIAQTPANNYTFFFMRTLT